MFESARLNGAHTVEGYLIRHALESFLDRLTLHAPE